MELGRRFGLRKAARLDAMYAGVDESTVCDPEDDWIDVCYGDEMSDEEFFVMILVALEAARGHAGATWCIADGLMDELVGRNQTYMLRFHDERSRNPDVAAAFEAMQEEADTSGFDQGWWGDDFPNSARQ